MFELYFLGGEFDGSNKLEEQWDEQLQQIKENEMYGNTIICYLSIQH
jgi:hypothetical protein